MEEQNTNKQKAQPEEISKGTYVPFLLAVSLLFLGWGMISNALLSLAGLIGFFYVLWKWIKEMMYERTED